MRQREIDACRLSSGEPQWRNLQEIERRTGIHKVVAD
jgi:hypothetical protein